jgi:hypothetical protein
MRDEARKYLMPMPRCLLSSLLKFSSDLINTEKCEALEMKEWNGRREIE